MALLRLIRSESFKLVAMGFLIGTAGVVLTQPGQAHYSAPTTAATAPAR